MGRGSVSSCLPPSDPKITATPLSGRPFKRTVAADDPRSHVQDVVAIYRGDLRTGAGAVFAAGAAGRAATGLKYDRGRLFVAGAATGKAFVYDATGGALLREYQPVGGSGARRSSTTSVVTKDAAYFTDSTRAVIFKMVLSRNGTCGHRCCRTATGILLDGKTSV